MKITPYAIAERFVGMKEIPGTEDNPQILAMLRLDMAWPKGDEVPWCSAFVNYCAWLLRLPRSKSLRARSWLEVGEHVNLEYGAYSGFDIVVLSRGKNPKAGHVGFYAGHDAKQVYLLGGNQGNTVSVRPFARSRVLGVRRLKA